VWAACESDVIVIYDIIEHWDEMIWSINASSIWIRLVIAWNFFSLAAEFTNLGLRGIWFYESTDKYVYEFFICVCEYTIALPVVAANNSISNSYDVMPIFNSIGEVLLRIYLIILSVVLVKGQSRFVTSYMSTWWAGGWKWAPRPSPLISILHSSPKSTDTQLPVDDWLNKLKPLCIQ